MVTVTETRVCKDPNIFPIMTSKNVNTVDLLTDETSYKNKILVMTYHNSCYLSQLYEVTRDIWKDLSLRMAE